MPISRIVLEHFRKVHDKRRVERQARHLKTSQLERKASSLTSDERAAEEISMGLESLLSTAGASEYFWHNGDKAETLAALDDVMAWAKALKTDIGSIPDAVPEGEDWDDPSGDGVDRSARESLRTRSLERETRLRTKADYSDIIEEMGDAVAACEKVDAPSQVSSLWRGGIEQLNDAITSVWDMQGEDKSADGTLRTKSADGDDFIESVESAIAKIESQFGSVPREVQEIADLLPAAGDAIDAMSSTFEENSTDGTLRTKSDYISAGRDAADRVFKARDECLNAATLLEEAEEAEGFEPQDRIAQLGEVASQLNDLGTAMYQDVGE